MLRTFRLNPVPGTVVYFAAKAGVDTIIKVLAKELGMREIRVNTIAPGITETEGTRDVIRGSDLEKQMLSITPLGRLGLPEDIAKVTVFLLLMMQVGLQVNESRFPVDHCNELRFALFLLAMA